MDDQQQLQANEIEAPDERKSRSPLLTIAAVVAVLALVVTFGRFGDRGTSRPVPTDMRILSFGYLSASTIPDVMKLIPPPPLQGSAEMRADEEARTAAISNPGAARLAQAATDSVTAFPQAAKNFACAFGMDIDKDKSPALYSLMGKILIDVRASASKAKATYRRTRPFVIHGTRSCAPEYAERVRSDGSYPSAQAATGWVYAMVLADLNPSRREALIERAKSFEQSRLVCDVQWKSDLESGRTIGAAVLERIRKSPEFAADLAAARAEAANDLKSGSVPPPNCSAEASALGLSRQNAG